MRRWKSFWLRSLRGRTTCARRHGCNNSALTGGATLDAVGSGDLSNTALTASSMTSTATCTFLQGDAVNTLGLVFGDGIRCAAGSLKRLYAKTASGGTAIAPLGTEPSIPQRSAALGDPIGPGTSRFYQVYYRDPASFACAAPATFNVTNAVMIDW